MKFLIFLIIIISSNSYANKLHEPLYLKFINNDVCIYTNNLNSKLRDDNVFLVTVGKFKDDPELVSQQIFKNISKIPSDEKNCVKLMLNKYLKSGTYNIILDMDKTYSADFCLTNNRNTITFHNIGSNMTCHKRDYKNPFHPKLEIKNLFSKIKNWLL